MLNIIYYILYYINIYIYSYKYVTYQYSEVELNQKHQHKQHVPNTSVSSRAKVPQGEGVSKLH